MKKILLISGVGLLVLMTSCKKDYTCECTNTDVNGKITISTVTIVKATRTDAKIACSNTSSTITINNQTVTDKDICQLK